MSQSVLKRTAYSVLNLSSVTEGGTIKESFEHSMDLAKRRRSGVIIDIGLRNTIIWKVLQVQQRPF